MTEVIKRNKKRQKFSRAKLERSIILAAREAKITASKAKQLARDVAEGISEAMSKRRSVKSTELRRRIFRRLESRSAATITAWRRYDRMKY